MELKKALEELKNLQMKMYAYSFAISMIYLDANTVAPSETAEPRGEALGILSGESHKVFANPETGKLLEFLGWNLSELDFTTRRQVEELTRDYRMQSKIPVEEYMEYSILLNGAQAVWQKAKVEDDFEAFRPFLEKIVEFNVRFAGYFNPDKKPYDALLDQYERGMTMATLDKYFAEVRATLIPLLKKISEKPQIDDSFLHKNYPIEQQRKLSDYLMDLMGLDRSHCTIGETEHPFETNVSNKDVRITTHYYDDSLVSSIYSVVHESGHALYELGGADEFEYTCLAGGVSMGLHESQSRFFENVIGRSREFVFTILPKLKELFPEQLEGVTAENFFRAVNKAEPSLIRIEADELTYSLHIMVRYEIEKQLIGGSLAVSDLPEAWNTLYKEYLGIDVPSNRDGCLQDSHWSGGSFGYFPSYSLGSAYAAQMLAEMSKDIDVFAPVSKGDLSIVTAWLRDKIHRHSSSLPPAELLKSAIGEFDPKYYTEYLTSKFSNLYDLEADEEA